MALAGSIHTNTRSGGSFEAEQFSLRIPTQRKVAAAGRQSLGGKFGGLVPAGNLFDDRGGEKGATVLTSANEDVYCLFRQSVEDMGALRLYDRATADSQWLPAAGVPWFVTIFDRESLIVSLQNMMINPGFARGALKKLAQFQAHEMDDWRDAEPGKILHELKFGDLAHFHRIPHTPYYGTADATPLYLIVLHEA